MNESLNLHRCYLRTFEGEAGKAVLRDIEARSFVNETSFSPDPHRAAFNEGRRSLVLHIRRMLQTEARGRKAG